MKRIVKYFGVSLLAGALITPALNSCKKGENDPGLSFRSRDSRISAEWTLDKMSVTNMENVDRKYDYDESDCETNAGVADHTVSITPEVTEGSISQSATASGDSVQGVQSWSSSWYEANRYKNMNTLSSGSFDDLNVTLSIRKGGTYDVTMNYTYTENNYQGSENNTFEESLELTNLRWHWGGDKEAKTKLILESFPYIDFDISATYEQDGDVDETYVSSMGIDYMQQEFYIDKLKHKELTLMKDGKLKSSETEINDVVWTDDNFNTHECEETTTIERTNERSVTLEFSSEGDNLKEE